MNQIKLILAHYEAYQKQLEIEDKLNEFVTVLSPGNFVFINCPFQGALEQFIEEPLKDWYFWWLYEDCNYFSINEKECY